MTVRRVGERVLVECATFLSPLVDPDEVLSDAIMLHQHVATWLPEARVMYVFAPDGVLSTYGRWVRTRMDVEGLRVSSRGSIIGERQRTRMLWHARGEYEPEGSYEFDLRADRTRSIVVETGSMFDGRQIADEVAAYKALMSFPS